MAGAHDVLRARITAPDGVALDAVAHLPNAGTGIGTGIGTSGGTVLLVHGISADLDEGGAFVRLAQRLAREGLTAVRFSFRGHGRSGGTPQAVTIAGEMLDLEAVAAWAGREFAGPLSVVAASFGAVATGLSLPWLGRRLSRLVSWNPVLDLHRTFLAPELPWGLANFGAARMSELSREGQLPLDGRFPLGRVLFAEMAAHRPLDACTRTDGPPALVVHGDRDAHVSFAIAREAAAALAHWEFHAIAGASHGFHSPEHEPEAIEVTTNWLLDGARATGRPPRPETSA